jgi:ABC-type lipoprotein release transport system permease subunit
MNFGKLIISDFGHYRKAFLAILAGTLVSTAILTGALMLGDSVKFSLERLTNIRLGKIRYALYTQDRYFRQDIAGDISVKTGSLAAPALLQEGIAVNPENNKRINRVQVVGIDRRFIMFWEKQGGYPGSNTAVISNNTANKLGLKPGDDMLIRISGQGMTPANAPFVAEKSSVAVSRFRVMAIADDGQMGRFSLKADQAAPFNVFIQLGRMASLLKLKGMANVLLSAEEAEAIYSPDSLFRRLWKPGDAGLAIHSLGNDSLNEITSGRIFIDNQTAAAIKSVLPGSRAFLTYLVNSFSFKARSAPYSFITAASPDFLGLDPGSDGIIINSWLAGDLGVKQGDSLRLKYFIMGSHRQLTEDSSVFVVRQVRPMQDAIWDPSLMPAFPGLSDAGNCRDWETGTPVDLTKIRNKDEEYWKQYRGTPKAFVSLASGQKLWANPFGCLTSIRFMAGKKVLDSTETAIMKKISPAQLGLAFAPIYREGKNSASNSTDFGELFLSLGFFIILAALLLVALLFSLHIMTRIKETGVLSALGFSKRQISGILFIEGLILAIAGGITGAMAGIPFDRLMLLGLNTIWLDAVGTSALVIKIRFSTLILGALSGILTTVAVLLLVLYTMLRKPAWWRVQAGKPENEDREEKKIRTAVFSAILFCLGSTGLVAYLLSGPGINNISLFLIAGALLIAGGSSAFYALLTRRSVTTKPEGGLIGHAFKNAALKRSRTMSAMILLALGIFSIFITAANRRTYFQSENDRHSGTGGFSFWAETSIPLRYDPSSPEGQKEYSLQDQPWLKNTGITSMQRFDGDDASCLNLNQATHPAIIGIPPCAFQKREAFGFLELLPGIDPDKPWSALQKPLGPGIIPAYADQTVITWGLRKKIGDTVFYSGANGEKTGLKLMGGLDNSIFQGYLLISDSLFRIHFPQVGGFKNFLIDGSPSFTGSISGIMETDFRDYGINLSRTSERLASFNSVENTYLSVFMLLGGLGVIIGIFGLGIVLLRNMLERKNELALYTALGFKRNFILKLIIAEYMGILFAGTGLGILSAFVAILPSILSPAWHIPGSVLVLIVAAFVLNGLLWVWLPARATLGKLKDDSISRGLV